MLYGSAVPLRDRTLSAAASIGLTLGIGWLLLALPQSGVPEADDERMDVIAVASPPPEVDPAMPRKAALAKAEGLAAPPARQADPRPVIAAPAPLPSALTAPTVTATGTADSVGATPVAGPGTGAGGVGHGLGAGAGGDGTGGGGGAARPRWRSGSIRNADYPDGASRANAGGTVDVALSISAEGRVTGCSITRSSGRTDLDETTCRLVQRRFRFHPARNAAGVAVPSEYGWRQRWWLGAAGGEGPG